MSLDLKASFNQFPEKVRNYLCSEGLSPGSVETRGMAYQMVGLPPENHEDWGEYARIKANLERMLLEDLCLSSAIEYLREVTSA